MSKKLQLDIPTPCHENWDKMTQVEKGRFCDSCQKQVVDFSNMSDREIAMFFKKPSTGSVCGRFMQDQLNRDFEIPKKRIPWLRYFFQFLLPGFLISMKATAQGKVKVVEKEICSVPNPNTTHSRGSKIFSDSTIPSARIVLGGIRSILIQKTIEEIPVIKGKIIDDAGYPVPYATIAIKNTKTGVAADANGIFAIKPEPGWKHITIVTSSVGFESKELQLNGPNRNDSIQIQLKKRETLGEVVVVADVYRHVAGMVCSTVTRTSKVKQQKLPEVFHKFRTFPNPALPGSTINIEWKQTEAGDHMLQLYNQSGQLVFTKPIYIDEEAGVLSIDLPTVLPGNYLLRMTHKTSGKSYTEKITIQ